MFIEQAYANNSIIEVRESGELLAKPSEPFYSGLTNIIPIMLIFGVLYFLLYRPQEKRRRLQENLVSGVKKGEEVIINGGIFGVVNKVNDIDATVEIEIAKDIQIKILKNAIINIVSRKKDDTTQKEDKPKKIKKL